MDFRTTLASMTSSHLRNEFLTLAHLSFLSFYHSSWKIIQPYYQVLELMPQLKVGVWCCWTKSGLRTSKYLR